MHVCLPSCMCTCQLDVHVHVSVCAGMQKCMIVVCVHKYSDCIHTYRALSCPYIELSAVTLSDSLVQDSASTEDLNNFIRNGEGGQVPGHVRVDVAAASQLTESWKMTNEFSNMVTWRYVVVLEVTFVLFVRRYPDMQ